MCVHVCTKSWWLAIEQNTGGTQRKFHLLDYIYDTRYSTFEAVVNQVIQVYVDKTNFPKLYTYSWS